MGEEPCRSFIRSTPSLANIILKLSNFGLAPKLTLNVFGGFAARAAQ